MNLTRSAITNNRITGVLVSLLFLSGILAFNSLPKAQDPGFIIRTAIITTQFPGASPERVELLVTDKIEKKVQEMPEVDNIQSESRTGISIITVNFLESYKNMRPIFDDLRRKVKDVEGELPEGIDPPLVNDEFGDVFGSVYTLTGDGYSYAELKTVADQIRDRLLKEPDIAKVSIHGVQKEVVFVEYDNARLSELQLSPQQLSQILGNANTLSSGGNIISGRERIVLEPTGNFESLADLQNTVIQLPSGSVVHLGDIAKVYRAYLDPPDSVSRANGEPTLAIAISMREGGDILKLGAQLKQLMPQIRSQYPWGVKIEQIWFQAELVENSVNDFIDNLGMAIIIVILVMVAFLGVRTGMVVAVLIPGTIVITFFLMQQFSITINQVSLAALIIALGLLVDNAIVMVESVLVKRQAGVGAVEAAVEVGNELKVPLLISSLTTAAAFMPIALAESAVGEYTADIFYVVSIALLTSWVLAMTLIPMLTSVALKVEAKSDAVEDNFDGRWYQLYRGVLLGALKNKGITLLLVVGVFVTAMWALKFVPSVFIAPSQDPVFSATFEMPIGTSIESSQEVMSDIEQFIRQTYYRPDEGEPLLKNWLTFIGEGGPRFTSGLNPPNQNAANTFLVANTFDGGESVEAIMAGIEQYTRDNHPDMSVRLSRLENGPPVGFPITIRLSGEDFDGLFDIAGQVTEQLYNYEQVVAVQNSWGPQTKKLMVKVDQDRARRAGVTSADVAYSLNASLSGIDMTQYREGSKLIPVTLRSVAADRQDIGKLDGLSVYSQSSGAAVPLKQVADVELVFESGMIERRDRSRTLSLKVQLLPGVTATEVNETLVPWLEQANANWPDGYAFALGGEAEESGKANASIAAKLPIAGMAIVLLLVIQFNSVRRTTIILTTIPLGLVGVTLGLLIARSSMGFFTLLGIISLAGIIINNAIVLIDRIKIEIDELGRTPADAVIHACQQRLRPIMLTTATTVLGMMPMWLFGTAMFKPMAVAIIFGLAFATLLTLLVVPVLYAGLFRVSYKNYQS